ncbi:MAG: hypothetical protein KDA63_04725 [Planctomycetales bacterium]|nr:hypothetical protein [Planctomycetales bacterium]
MWRAFFLAVGITAMLLGAECLAVDKVIVRSPSDGAGEISPPDWAPWSMISAGAVTVLYSFTIPQRVKG